MKEQSKIIIVGAGPAGSFTAYNVAKNGINTTIYEEHKEIGVPAHCAGHLSIKGLNTLGLLPLPKDIIQNTFRGAVFHSSKGRQFSVRFPKPVTCTVNRQLFDRHLAQKAIEAGAKYSLDSRVESLLIKDSAIKGVTIRQNGKQKTDSADLVVDSEGLSSRILRQTGLHPPNPQSIISGVEAEVENIADTEPNSVEIFLGRAYASGFYAWLIPLGNDRAKLGLGTQRGNPKQLLNKLMTKHPSAQKKLSGAKIIKTAYHPITLGGPMWKLCTNGFLTVGDVASQVKPTTGGGVIFALTCAQLATKTIQAAITNNDFSAKLLSTYERQCKQRFGFDVNVMLRTRKLLNALSDDQIDRVIGICSRFSVDEALQRVSEIDFQGKTLLSVLPDPRMWTVLFYLLFLYLSANP